MRSIHIVDKTCFHCGHDRAFDKKAGYFCTRCKRENLGGKIQKNKHGKERLIVVI